MEALYLIHPPLLTLMLPKININSPQILIYQLGQMALNSPGWQALFDNIQEDSIINYYIKVVVWDDTTCKLQVLLIGPYQRAASYLSMENQVC